MRNIITAVGSNLIKQLEEMMASNPDIKGFIAHRGEPPGLHECSKCRELKGSEHFKYYQNRVDKNGYLIDYDFYSTLTKGDVRLQELLIVDNSDAEFRNFLQEMVINVLINEK